MLTAEGLLGPERLRAPRMTTPPPTSSSLGFDAGSPVEDGNRDEATALRDRVGMKHWLWRAVDQAGIVLDVLVQSRRDKHAAKRLLRKLLKKQLRPPRVLITDKLASYGAAKREVMPGIEHRQHKGLNNRAENSHQPTAEESGR